MVKRTVDRWDGGGWAGPGKGEQTMRARTLFHAYTEAVARRDWAADCRRKGRLGIMVDTDDLAVDWRRYDRLAEKIWGRLVGCFGNEAAGPFSTREK